MCTDEPLKIQDYAIIGDCRAAALIGCDGSLDWLCWPRFDSPAIFARILDHESGGYWQITPSAPYAVSRRYIPETNVLETTFRCATGVAVLTDLMPVASQADKRVTLVPEHEILRQVECTFGEVEIFGDFWPRAEYGVEPVRMHQRRNLGLRMQVGRGTYWLRSTHSMECGEYGARSCIQLRFNEVAQFSLTYAEDAPAVLCCLGKVARKKIETSNAWWKGWADRAVYDGAYREAVLRSALSLKLLTYAPSGAIVAAATTSLPERVGADLNWDYRYCWLRDASLTVRALIGLGYWEEAEAFMSWMLQATRLTQPEMRIVYTVFGENAPKERERRHLSGYCGSRPVRIGNGARNQLQLDVYGEVIDAVAQFAFHGRRFDRITQRVLLNLGKYVIANWRSADDGIWEPRSGRQPHTHSRLLCWVALDRLHRLIQQNVIEHAAAEPFAVEADAIRRDIHENAWNESLGSYTSVLGGDELDASLLLMTWYGFEDADSARILATHKTLERELRAGPALLYRYKTDPPEGAFGICSFWEAEYLALGGGTIEQAQTKFERLLSYANDVGLYAEEIDPTSGDALGNFPQAFTHVGLINAALSLQERKKGTRQLAHRSASAERPPSRGDQ